MRFDVHNIVLELILTAAAVFWWMSRTPNTTHNCKRKQNWYLIWPGIGPVFAPVNYPLESLLVNIASLSGTVLGDILRPSQAIFSVLLVLHDAWPLLFTLVSSTSATSPTSSSTNHHHHHHETTNSHNNKDASSSSTSSSSSSPNYNRVPNRKNWMRVFYISTIFLFVYFFLYLVLGGDTTSEYEEEEKVVSHGNYNSHKIQQQQLHHDYEFSLTRTPSAPQNNNRVNSRSEERQQHNQRRNKKTSSSSSTSLGIGGLIIHYGAVISGYLAGFGALLVAARHAADFVNQAAYQEKLMNHYQHASPTTATAAAQAVDGSASSPFAFHPPPQPQHDVLDSGAAAAGTSNALQHSALVFTYFVYGIMLLVDFSSLGESGPWLLYVSGSVFIEVVKHFWIFRIKSLNVDTIV